MTSSIATVSPELWSLIWAKFYQMCLSSKSNSFRPIRLKLGHNDLRYHIHPTFDNQLNYHIHSWIMALECPKSYQISDVRVVGQTIFVRFLWNLLTITKCIISRPGNQVKWHSWITTLELSNYFPIFVLQGNHHVMLTWLLKNSSRTQWVGKSC